VGTVITFLDNNERPYAEIALDNGDRIAVTLDATGLTIRQIGGTDSGILFQAGPDIVARLCTAFVERSASATPTPLRIVVAAVVQLASAELVARAFHDATARIS
jgi:hypothetical protein